MNRKTLRIILEAIVIIVIIIGFIIINAQITDDRISSFKLRADSNEFAYQVESITVEGEEYVIKGWFFRPKRIRNIEQKDLGNGDISILLYNLDTNGKGNEESQKLKKGITTITTSEYRSDINEYFKCEYDYSYCGFVSKVNKSLIDLNSGNYQIVLKEDKNSEYGIGIAFISDGVIKYVSPKDDIKLNVVGTDLEHIVLDGTCVVSCPEYHISVFQYKWKLYWIADNNYSFEQDGNTYIDCVLETTQFEKLPKTRTDNGWYWGNIGTSFESCEITKDLNCGEYRVCVMDLPADYSLTQIMTGSFKDNVWIWQKSFRPNYLLKD